MLARSVVWGPEKEGVFFREATVRRWRVVGFSCGEETKKSWKKESPETKKLGERERSEDSEGDTAEIRTANCRQSGWLGSGIVIPQIPMPESSIPPYSTTTFAVVLAEERSMKIDSRGGLSSRESGVRTARAGRLGFCRGNPVELRTEGFLFMRQIDDTCTRTLLSHRILSVSPTACPSLCVAFPRHPLVLRLW